MLLQIFIGSVLIISSVIIASTLIACAIKFMKTHENYMISGEQFVKTVFVLSALTLWIVAILTIVVWLWALTFWIIGVFETVESSLYFSLVSFTTLGFGDITLPEQWRLLSGFIATNGFLLFGLGTAFLFESIIRIRDLRERND